MSMQKATIIDKDVKDGLENFVASMGTEGDKRSHTRFTNNRQLSRDGAQSELSDMYRTTWVAGKVVDIIPDDMTREWREFNGDMDPSIIKKFTELERTVGLKRAFNFGSKWSRLFGTSFIVMAIDDGQDLKRPLSIDKLKVGCLKHIKVIDRHRVTRSGEVTQDPMSVNFGMPEYYRFVNSAIEIHHSRMLRFDAVELPYDQLREANYWSDSVLDRLYEPMIDFYTTFSGTASMVFETNVDVIRLPGLMDKLATTKGEADLRKRFGLANLLKSFNNLMLLDKTEEYEKKQNTFAGLSELMDRQIRVLTAATDIPATRFMGDDSSGLNATGSGSLKNYYDMLKSQQSDQYDDKLTIFDAIMAKHLGINDTDLGYNWKSLFQMTPKEQSDLEKVDADRDAIYLERNVVKPSAVAKELVQKGTYTNITPDDIKELEEIEEFNEDEDEEIEGESGIDGDDGEEDGVSEEETNEEPESSGDGNSE